MPPRIPILSALRQGMSVPKTPTAPLSTTAAPQALRDIKNSTASMLSIDSTNSGNETNLASDVYRSIRSMGRNTLAGRQRVTEDLSTRSRNADYMRQLPRRWRTGDVYSPHDMSISEVDKWRKTTARKQDLVDLLGLRPLDMYRNFSVISEFITPHGRIMRSVETGLSPVNQRKMAKAIRRAIGLGLHPSVHRHPELLLKGPDKMLAQHIATQNKALRV
ncbi:ribosomal protein S18 [Xylaria bambusicola]|uniref:ribosomal protein S18 n=1 Tax=Xylaria bambusicola TaxID=326684 RepID=UPI002007252D|nr:ribosomal protein S18 [Xylaria bambusicola]KAI0514523.1 ribosomal protein S18 [Xylaria bambusicola]